MIIITKLLFSMKHGIITIIYIIDFLNMGIHRIGTGNILDISVEIHILGINEVYFHVSLPARGLKKLACMPPAK